MMGPFKATRKMARLEMSRKFRFIVIIPIVLCFVSFILTTLTLVSGHQKGFMEDYAIIRLNTSMIARDIFQSAKSQGQQADSRDGLLGKVQDHWQDAKDDLQDKASQLAGSAIGNVADRLGVAGWYSLHIMNSCEGNYGRNATAKHFKLNVTKCSASSPAYHFNLSQILDHEMSAGPLHINLAQIGWSQSIQSEIDTLNAVLFTLFILYALGICFTGLATFAAVPFGLFTRKTWPVHLNIWITSLAALFIFLASIILTAASAIGTSAINKAGAPFNVVAEQDNKLPAVSWIATVFIVFTNFFWRMQLQHHGVLVY